MDNKKLRINNKELELLIFKLSEEIEAFKVKAKKSEEETLSLKKKQKVLRYWDWTQGFMRILVNEFQEIGSYTELKEIIATEMYKNKHEQQLKKN